MSPITFTWHACVRAQERLSLTQAEIGKILEDRHCLNIGEEQKTTTLEHLLFYSEPDDTCFVAINDKAVNEIITILPIDYHENVAWKISTEAQKMAKKLIVQEPAKSVVASKKLPKSFVLAAMPHTTTKWITLGTYPTEGFNADGELFAISDVFHEVIGDRLFDKGVVCDLAKVSIRNGRRGNIVIRDWCK